MNDFKSWLESKTIWGIIVMLIPVISALLGFDFNTIIAALMEIGGGIFAIYSRFTATKKLQ